ncbi:spermidine synthase [SAR202 cluster bacterium AD-804-J14_MRT_500m]|nr:spermidine synthase [SAR202 cluster bacterium AD-804-J14_MRT_500m]
MENHNTQSSPLDFTGKWFFELITSDLVVMYRIQRSLHTTQTVYQSVEILDTESLGRSLILDGKTQSATLDEHIYHESLVHPGLLMHPNPQTVFIGGGGEGATLREVLTHKSVNRAVMIDLDGEVVDLCRRYIPDRSCGAFEDPRLELKHQDARAYLTNTSEKFDAIVLDLVDPLEGGTAYKLYTQEFYKIARSRLNSGGMLITQSGPAGLLNFRECFTPIIHTLSGVFTMVQAYSVYIPSFVTPWGFCIATDSETDDDSNPQVVDRQIKQRINSTPRFYDGETRQHMFSLMSYLRRGIEEEQRTITDDNPVFMV